ncbi:MAG: VTT domain-containing protein [Planctomycetaceae bacterium]|nr:VTT domain-containing protein [Planctomycetaceae bacterium]
MENEQPETSPAVKKSVTRLVGLILLAMLIPVIPFVFFGEFLEDAIESWIQGDFSLTFRLAVVVLCLLVDIFLPVPSSAVITYAGATCGIISATLAAWAGLTLGALLGYELGRLLGSRLINRLSSQQDREQMQKFVSQYGGLAIVLTRPLPILGETAVLIVGSLFMRRSVFYLSVALSNLAISLVYASFGYWFSDPSWLPWIIAASLIAPLMLTFAARRYLSARQDALKSDSTNP